MADADQLATRPPTGERTIMAKLPKTKQGALAAAKKDMGPEAIEGVDFDVTNTGAGWAFHPVGQGPVAAASTDAPKAPRKAKAKAAPAASAPKPPRAPRKANEAPAAAPKGPSKADTILDLIKRPQGADVTELSAASKWQKHSVRSFIAGTLKKKGVEVVTTKEGEGKDRRTVYRVADTAEQPI
jgi:hypothetical protein